MKTPHNPGIRRIVLHRCGSSKLEEGMADFARAIEPDPRLAAMYFNRAGARQHLNDWAGALEDHRKGAALDRRFGDRIKARIEEVQRRRREIR
jgi:hypothetical protein